MHRAGKQYSAVEGLRIRTATAAATGLVAALLLAGCGNSYRPVVTAINPVGPSGQPTKYAVAVSSPSPTSPGLLTAVDFSGDTVLSTPSILVNPSYFTTTANGVEGFVINQAGSFNQFGLSNPTALQTNNVVQTTLPAASSPVSISAISVGGTTTTLFVPEAATNKIAALSIVGPSLIQEISVGPKPVYVVGSDGATRVYAISQNNAGNGQLAALEASTLSISATIPVGVKPVYGVMTADGKRAFILNQGSGTVSVVNVINNGLDSAMPVIPAAGTLGVNPIWADFAVLTNELTVLSAGNGVNALGTNYQGAYSATATYQLNQVVSSGSNLYIDVFNGTTPAGTAVTNTTYFTQLQPGSLSVISIPLCTASSQITNPNCSTTNPVDATGFGQVLATVPVGIGATMVSVLHDGTRAYVTNQFDTKCTAGEGSVSVVNLQTGQVSATICGISTAAGTVDVNTTPTKVYGHPTTISATSGDPTGKVYVTSPDNRYLTVIYTDTDSVVTHIPLQGLGVRVLVTQP